MYSLSFLFLLIGIGVPIPIQSILIFKLFLAAVSGREEEYRMYSIIINIVFLLTNFIFAFIFNDLYIKEIKKRIFKIKKDNPKITQEELIEICKRKGGTLF